MHKIRTFNQISQVGLDRFSESEFMISPHQTEASAYLLRSHKLEIDDLHEPRLRAIARAGAGTNNVPVQDCTEKGIVVFNTPGANANAVKELVLCGMLLASRGVVPGINFASAQQKSEEYSVLAKLMETEKKRFKGTEIAGKTLGVVGLGAIGSLVAEMALSLGMKVQGYDPALSVEAAWRLSSDVRRIENLKTLASSSDFISLHMPVLEATRGLIDAKIFASMLPSACLLNFARDEIVNSEALLFALENSQLSKYVTDFPRPELLDREDVISMPHIGASTMEAEQNCAIMAADQLTNFLQNGNIKNSVNFPQISLDRDTNTRQNTRLTISNKNLPKTLGQILAVLSDQNLNVVDMINKSRDEIAYNLIDLEISPKADTVRTIAAIENVTKVTLL
ncbi:MAG: 3-phosphoglycerate dehydrogenase family protein [Gammaproteobacteria bacterium]|nr:3-phosphoglycerate dehydrogenase family protein [Gammaproteobacteria bacterium]MDG1951535.1 3-phosphoglycerate dehydrogenase family protein [Gammaproteobacteria bacterium]MDG2118379.1 3-phosphoglycerate dehydrogenase family protein [Gammaproteobacteria bacterium]